MPGRDPRSEDSSDEIAGPVEAFSPDPQRRGATSHIVGRAAVLLSLFRSRRERSEAEVPASQLAPVPTPAWTQDDFADAARQFAELPRYLPLIRTLGLRNWAAEQPDDIELGARDEPIPSCLTTENGIALRFNS
jgi:hypothetical protein